MVADSFYQVLGSPRVREEESRDAFDETPPYVKSSKRKKRNKSDVIATPNLSIRTRAGSSDPISPVRDGEHTASPAPPVLIQKRLSDREIGYYYSPTMAPTRSTSANVDQLKDGTPKEAKPARKPTLGITTQLSASADVSGTTNLATHRSTGTMHPAPAGTIELQSFRQYLAAESNPEQTYPTTDVIWGQTERDKVYNFLLHVPYQLERVMWYGCAICLDSFLACLTVLPFRALVALRQLLPGSKATVSLRGSQLFDIICCAVLAAATWCLLLLDPGAIYFSIKDIISEFLKIHVISTALELFDKILSNFGVDVLTSLSGTCTLWVQGSPQRTTRHLLSDAIVAFVVVVLHAAVHMCQAIVFSVAMTSKHSTLLALLIASSFVEIKGTVYKRMDVTKLWNVACMDIVERVHLLAVLSFVVVEDLRSAGTWRPSPSLLLVCGQVVAAEVVIDIIKHAVLGKFNDIRPGVYREFMKDLSEKAGRSQSHNMHKHVGFHHMPVVALGLRMGVTLLGMVNPRVNQWRLVVALWLLLAVLKVAVGYSVKFIGYQYFRYYNQRYGSVRGGAAAAAAKKLA